MNDFLKSIGVFEKDDNHDVMLVWSYPIIEKELENSALNYLPLKNEKLKSEEFLFTKISNYWNYFITEEDKFTIILTSKEFYPEKYEQLGQLFKESYKNDKNVLKLLTGFLQLFGSGKYSSFKNDDFDSRKAKISPFKDIISIFQEHSCIIWSAMLLKKRIVVYSENVKELENFVRSLPCFCWSRQNWDIIYPIIDFEKEIDFNLNSIYCAGTLNNVENNSKLYDLYLDLVSGTLKISDNSIEDLKVTKLHKDITKEMLKLQNDNNQLIKGVAVKTKEIISKLDKFIVDDEFSIEKLNSFNLDSNLEKFLINLASSENLI